jgi:hypothetical protein
MSMIMAVDTMASRYGMLPSRVMQDANTFDLVIMDAALGYQNYLRNKDDPNHVPDVSVEELLRIKDGVL